MKKYLLILLTLFLLYNPGESLKCWYCTPTARPRCENEISKSNVKELECFYNNSYPVCRIMTSFLSNGEFRVIIRDCQRRSTYSNNLVAPYINSTEEPYVVETITSYCDTDFCNSNNNSAKSTYSDYKLIFFITFVFFYAFKSFI